MSDATIQSTNRSARTADIERVEGSASSAASESGKCLLPMFAASGPDDLMTALSILMIKQKQGERTMNDEQRAAAEKATERAHNDKIAKMREAADDIFTKAVTTGILDGISAAASCASATVEYKGAFKAIDAEAMKGTCDGVQAAREAAALNRNAKLLDVANRSASSTSRVTGLICDQGIEDTRTDTAVADRAVERAKTAADDARQDVARAADDLRTLISAMKSLLDAKNQLANAAILRG